MSEHRHVELRRLMDDHKLTYRDVATITQSSERTVGAWLMHPGSPNSRRMPDLKWSVLAGSFAKKAPASPGR
jgi:hypothetical protein